MAPKPKANDTGSAGNVQPTGPAAATVPVAPNAWTELVPGVLIEAVPSGTQADGSPITRTIRCRLDRAPWGYDPARGTYIVSDGTSPFVVVANSVRIIAAPEHEGYDHTKCEPGAHDRDPGANTRQIGDQDSDGQLVDSDGNMLCNDCEKPLVYCKTHDVYVHLEPDTEPCFLVSEALEQLECENCGGVENTERYWDGELVRYADPECAKMRGWSQPTTSYGRIMDATLTDNVTEALGEYADNFDIPGLVAAYRDAIQAELPDGVTVLGDGELYGPYPHRSFDREAVLERVDFWAISPQFDETAGDPTAEATREKP